MSEYEDATQIAKLTQMIIKEVPGEPSRNEDSVECAMRLIRRYMLLRMNVTQLIEDMEWTPDQIPMHRLARRLRAMVDTD